MSFRLDAEQTTQLHARLTNELKQDGVEVRFRMPPVVDLFPTFATRMSADNTQSYDALKEQLDTQVVQAMLKGCPLIVVTFMYGYSTERHRNEYVYKVFSDPGKGHSVF